MTDGLSWIPSAYEQGFAATFVADREPEDVLLTLGARPDSILPLTHAEAEEIELANWDPDQADVDLDFLSVDDEELRARGFRIPRGKVLRAGRHGVWTFVLETPPNITARAAAELSQGTTVYSVSRTVNAATWFNYARNGAIRADCDPFDPRGELPPGLDPEQLRFSEDPLAKVLAHLESEVGILVPGSSEFEGLPSACFAD